MGEKNSKEIEFSTKKTNYLGFHIKNLEKSNHPSEDFNEYVFKTSSKFDTEGERRSSTQTLISRANNFMGDQVSAISNLLYEFQLSLFWILVVPIIFTILCAAAFILLVRSALETRLPSIIVFDIIHVLLFLLSDMIIHGFKWTLKQRYIFKQAFKLVSHTTKMRNIQESVNPSLWKHYKTHVLILLVFFGLHLFIAITAEWSELGEFGNPLGHYDCMPPVYNNATLKNIFVDPKTVTGAIGFASLHMYGLPTKDGIVTGVASRPLKSPIDQFIMEGQGPVVTFRVKCQADPEPFYGYNFTALGSGSRINRLHVSRLSFNSNIDIFLPIDGFKPKTVESESPWVMQQCWIDANIGWGSWHFKYEKDEWHMMKSGRAVSVQMNGLKVSRVEDHGKSKLVEKIDQEIISHTQMTGTQEEQSHILIEAIARAFKSTLNNVWYKPSYDVTFSNIMSWGTEPDGYYYSHLTERGLKGAIGAISNQIYLQYQASSPEKCAYWGSDGSGIMHLNPSMVVITNSYLAIIVCLLMGGNIYSYLAYPIEDHVLFRTGLLNVKNDSVRFFNSLQWGTNLLSKNEDLVVLVEKFQNADIRYGNKIFNDGEIQQIIGPSNVVRKIVTKKKEQSEAQIDMNTNDVFGRF